MNIGETLEVLKQRFKPGVFECSVCTAHADPMIAPEPYFNLHMIQVYVSFNSVQRRDDRMSVNSIE